MTRTVRPSTTTHLRLVNATSVCGLKLTATSRSDSTATSSSEVDAGGAGGYASLTSGTCSVFASNANGLLATSGTISLSLSADVYNTVVAYSRGGHIRLLTLTDSQTAASSGYASITIANAGSDAGALDVYLPAPGSTVTGTLSPMYDSAWRRRHWRAPAFTGDPVHRAGNAGPEVVRPLPMKPERTTQQPASIRGHLPR